MEHLSRLRLIGFSVSKINIDTDLKKFAEYVNQFNHSSLFSNLREQRGYSNDIFALLNKDQTDYIKILADKILSLNSWMKYFMVSPKVLQIQVLKSNYDDKSAVSPTHAMLWHRDADDNFSHVKVIIPLHKIDENNGFFSVADKRICKIHEKLNDVILQKKLDSIGDDYTREDSVRVTDDVFRKHFFNKIFDFKSDLGDILFVDTNRCYHKGGHIIKKNLNRNIIIITIGGITHSFNNYFKDNYFSFAKILAKFLNYLITLKFYAHGGKNSKKINLN